VQVGDMVKTTTHPHAKDYPTGYGIVVGYRDHGLHSDYNSVVVLWPATGDKRPVRQMFLEVISERR